jgi:hypothetical protein
MDRYLHFVTAVTPTLAPHKEPHDPHLMFASQSNNQDY